MHELEWLLNAVSRGLFIVVEVLDDEMLSVRYTSSIIFAEPIWKIMELGILGWIFLYQVVPTWLLNAPFCAKFCAPLCVNIGVVLAYKITAPSSRNNIFIRREICGIRLESCQEKFVFCRPKNLKGCFVVPTSDSNLIYI